MKKYQLNRFPKRVLLTFPMFLKTENLFSKYDCRIDPLDMNDHSGNKKSPRPVNKSNRIPQINASLLITA